MPQQPELGQTRLRTQELHLGFLNGYRGPALEPDLLLPQAHSVGIPRGVLALQRAAEAVVPQYQLLGPILGVCQDQRNY